MGSTSRLLQHCDLSSPAKRQGSAATTFPSMSKRSVAIKFVTGAPFSDAMSEIEADGAIL